MSLLPKIMLAIVIFLAIWFVFDGIRIFFLIRKSKILIEKALPFERMLLNASMNILILGDSTAVGTGSDDNTLSTAGRLGTLYPEATIENLGKNGLRIKEQIEIVKNLDAQMKYDLILVQIGANDIIRLTSLKDIEKDLNTLSLLLSTKTNKLIILHSGDIGESRFFPLYIRPLFTQRSYKVRDIYKGMAQKNNFIYVDLIDSKADILLQKNPDMYYAPDLLHLNGLGYGLWFDEIRVVCCSNSK